MAREELTGEPAVPADQPGLAEKAAAARAEKGPREAGSRRVFVSYSRKDGAFVRDLVAALAPQGIDSWVDWEAIPKTAKWRDEIAAGIEACDSFLFVLSPASIASEPCRDELEHALKYNKRIIPVVCAHVPPRDCPPAVEQLNWIFMHTGDVFESGMRDLLDAIDTDLDWVHLHTYLLGRAVEWEAKGRDRALLLRGSHLAAAEQWLAGAAGKQPAPTALHTEYILAGRKAATARQRLGFGVTFAGLIIAIALSIFAFLERGAAIQERTTAQARLLTNEVLTHLDSDPQLSLLLGIDAVKLQDSAATEAALRQAMAESQQLRIIHGGLGPLFSLAFSPDGRYLAAGSTQQGAGVWDARTGQRLGTAGEGSIESVQFSRDGRYLLAGNVGNLAQVIDLQGSNNNSLGNEGDEVQYAAYSPDGRYVATADRDSTAHVWDVRSQQEVAVLRGHRDELLGVAFDPTGRYIATASGDHTARVWDWRRERALAVLRGHTGAVWSATFSPDGRYLVTASDDDTARVWDWRTGRTVDTLTGHTAQVQSAVFSPDGRYVLTASVDKTARLWNWRNGKTVGIFAGHTDQVEQAVFVPGKAEIATAGFDGTIRYWRLPRVVLTPRAALSSLTLSHNGKEMLAASLDGTVHMWAWPSLRPLPPLTAGCGPLYGAAIDPGNRYVAVACDRGVVPVWDLRTRRSSIMPGPNGAVVAVGGVAAVAFSPNGRYLAVATNEAEVLVWDWRRRALLTEMGPGTYSLHCLSFSPDGQYIAAGGDGENILIWRWRAKSETPVATLNGDTGAIYGAVFSPDGNEVVTGSADDTVRIWDWRRGRQLAVLAGHTDVVGPAAFSPDSRYFVTPSNDRTVRVWNWQSRDLLVVLRGHADLVNGAIFSPDGREIVSASSDGTLRVYDTKLLGTGDQLLSMAQSQVVRSLTPQERVDYL